MSRTTASSLSTITGLTLSALTFCWGCSSADGDGTNEETRWGGGSSNGVGSAAGGAFGLGGGTGNGATTGGSGGSGADGSGGATEPATDPCTDGEWTCVRTEPTGPYGERTLTVPAAQNWVNTGLFLKAGETATLQVTGGTWFFNSMGDSTNHGGCLIGDMVARIGLHYEEPVFTCVGDDEVTFTADKDGILFVGALAGNDLGETYETRYDATGEKTIVVESQNATVPTVLGSEASAYDFDGVSSHWVEVWGEHVILTLPAFTAEMNKGVLEMAVDTLDEIYDHEAELRGALPHSGQRLRFFPDGTNPGLMLAGNPIRMQLNLVTDNDRISRAGQEGVDLWGYAHEMGHDFSFAGRQWSYQDKTLESWCNIFSLYSLEKMGKSIHGAATSCTASSTGNYNTWDAWGGLCFLQQFQFKYGWDFYKSFFTELNKYENNQGIRSWHDNHNTFEAIAGEDVTPIFNTWGVPNSG